MSFLKRPQIIILSVAIVVVVLLLLLPRTSELVQEDVQAVGEEAPVTNTDYVSAAMASLSNQVDKDLLGEIQTAIDNESDPLSKIDLLDSLSTFWETRQRPVMAADQLYEIALIIQDKPSYFIAGDRYYKAFQELKDDRKIIALNKAVESYEAVLDLLPEDLEAMTSLGVCYVEGSSFTGQPPMKGIGMLRKVLEIDPDNINALINLGYFSAKSGQYEKAIARFERVLEIDPEFAEAYLYLSDTYIQMGEKEKAIESLESFKQFVDDPVRRQQMDVFIENIRNNNI